MKKRQTTLFDTLIILSALFILGIALGVSSRSDTIDGQRVQIDKLKSDLKIEKLVNENCSWLLRNGSRYENIK